MITEVSNITLPPPTHPKHVLRLAVYLIVMALVLYLLWRDLVMHTSTQYLPTPPCRVDTRHQCTFPTDHEAVVLYENAGSMTHTYYVSTVTPTP